MAKNTCYFQRLLARLMDLSLTALIIVAAETINARHDSVLLLFCAYNLTVILCGGKTLGKHAFSLKVQSVDKGLKKVFFLFAREILLFVLFPFLAVNFIFISRIALHDKIVGSRVVKDER